MATVKSKNCSARAAIQPTTSPPRSVSLSRLPHVNSERATSAAVTESGGTRHRSDEFLLPGVALGVEQNEVFDDQAEVVIGKDAVAEMKGIEPLVDVRCALRGW